MGRCFDLWLCAATLLRPAWVGCKSVLVWITASQLQMRVALGSSGDARQGPMVGMLVMPILGFEPHTRRWLHTEQPEHVAAARTSSQEGHIESKYTNEKPVTPAGQRFLKGATCFLCGLPGHSAHTLWLLCMQPTPFVGSIAHDWSPRLASLASPPLGLCLASPLEPLPLWWSV